MLHYKTIEPHTLSILKRLFNENISKECRLVGGTSLALQYGHRCSVDLDLFGKIRFDAIEIQNILNQIGKVIVIKNTSNIHLFIVDGVRVDIVNYNYEWIDDCINEDGLFLASDKDISAMKISAIENRGTKKDFIDLYYLLQKYSFNEILSFYSKKYPNHSLFRALMSITYFDDAESDPMPLMLKTIDWSIVKETLLDTVSKYKTDTHK